MLPPYTHDVLSLHMQLDTVRDPDEICIDPPDLLELHKLKLLSLTVTPDVMDTHDNAPPSPDVLELVHESKDV